MKFLVILICLTINYLWLRDFDRFNDTWFFRFRAWVERSISAVGDKTPSTWLLGLLAIYVLPLIFLVALLLLINGSFYGLPTMLIHILVLLVAFDRTQPGKLASDFLTRWKSGDTESCVLYLQQELGAVDIPDTDSKEALGEYFSKQLIYRCFEKMFVMFFWYMVAGPLGILFCYISYQLRDSHTEEHLEPLTNMVAQIIAVLEWVPIRLLAVTFSLAGNFVKCFENVKRTFWGAEADINNSDLLYSYASCALSGLLNGSSTDKEDGQTAEEGEERTKQELEIEALIGLLERSQAIWLSVLALITIFGMRV